MIACVREVLQGEGAAEPWFGAHFIPTQNISWEHCFWWLRPVEQQPSAAKQAPTCLPEGASQPGPGRKGGGVDVCMCKKTKISVASIPDDFPFKKKKITTVVLFSSSCLFSLERVIFSFLVFLLCKHTFSFLALREEEEKKVRRRKRRRKG